MPMLYAISVRENVNVNPSLLETHMYAASRCTGVQEVVALMPCVRMVNSAPVSQAMVLTLSLGANQCPDVSGNVDSMHIVTHRTGSACADLDTWEMPTSDVDTFTQFLAEGSVVKTPSVEKACVSVNLVVMATHTQIV